MIGLAALILTVTLPVPSETTSVSVVARLVTYALILFVFFVVYELVGYAFGQLVARFLREPSQTDQPRDNAPGLASHLGPATAFLALVTYLGTQVLVIVIGAIVVGTDVAQSQSFLAFALLAATVLGGAAVIALTIRVAPDVIRTPGAQGIGLVPVPAATIAKSAIIAAAFALVVVYAGPRLAPLKANVDYGPLTRLIQSGGWARMACAAIAILLAPPVEEFVFRGVLLAGFAGAWGIRVAASIVTILFVGMHLPYVARYWPALLGLTILALLLVIVRMRTGSLLPGIAAHLAYNFVVVAAAFAGQP